MKFPWANTLLLGLVVAQLTSGFAGLVNGAAPSGWMLRVHDAGAFAIVVLLAWKGIVVRNSLRRRRTPPLQRSVFLTLGIVLLATLGTGLFWVFAGRTQVSDYSLITLHVLLALGLTLLLAWHVFFMRVIFRLPEARDRRAVLRLAAVSIAGLALWRSSERLLAIADLPGAFRRFTGSYETGSFTGNFPIVSWLFDRPAPCGFHRVAACSRGIC